MNLAKIPDYYNPQVSYSSKSKFGDYQVNGIIKIGNKLKQSPYKLAKKVLFFLKLKEIAKKIEVTPSGFINIFINHFWLECQLNNMINQLSLGISVVKKPQTIVVDYSSPNIAKQMHVGHLRSTIIGDSVVRTLIFLGHKVIRANHVGDWGTQFGMLIAYIKRNNLNINNVSLEDLEKFYCAAKKIYDTNKDFAQSARKYVVKLQKKDHYCLTIWKTIVDITMQQNNKIYRRLNLLLTDQDIMGESLYQNMLPKIIEDLKLQGLAVENEGAVVVFLENFKNKQGDKLGLIIQKKDGAYLYTTTDIACAKFRYEMFKADRILYYVDSRQNQHFIHTWSILRKAGYIPQNVSLEHHAIGMVLDKNGKPFQTRGGDTIKLSDLLDEAYNRAAALIKKKQPNLSDEQLKKISEILGISAIKYAELSKNRTTDYIFDWDNMISFVGNTAPYMQYAYIRIISIFRKAQEKFNKLTGKIFLINDYEKQLAICLIRFEEILTQVGNDGTPHLICNYLYELAELFSRFYENCPILSLQEETIITSRLQIALLTAKTLEQGLNILGIKTLDYM